MTYLGGTWSERTGGLRYEARRGGETSPLVLEVTETRCVDTMSGARYPYRVVLTRGARRMDGCALEGRQAIRLPAARVFPYGRDPLGTSAVGSHFILS